MNKSIYLIYWLISHPFKKFIAWLEKMDTWENPAVFLRVLIILTIATLFPTIYPFFIPHPNPLTVIFGVMMVLVYVWKHTDPHWGQLWKKDYKLREEKNGINR